ncbi:MAG: carboxypeptidase-like regulatory domain-containing protein [Bryobacteraceae bacterium]|nr:carboxypeptidase-like regulatory domain-containing protein [Bryobacteraceae bacterium]
MLLLRPAWILIGAATLQFAQQPTVKPASAEERDKATVTGQAVNIQTGEPLRKVVVTMVPSGRRPEARPSGVPTAVTAADGKFTIAGIDPGRYTLSAERNGYVRFTYGARKSGQGMPLQISAGETVKDLSLKMTPHGVVSGRILDDDGDPMAQVQVQVLRQRYREGQKHLEPAGSDSTNDLGEFRISSLPAGRYFVAAVPPRYVRTPGTEQAIAGLTTTLFPGVSDPATAAPVDVAAGQELRGVDFKLLKTQVVTVSGRISNMPAKSDGPEPVIVVLQPKRPGISFQGPPFRAVMQQDRFTFRTVPQGSYLLMAMVPRQRGGLNGQLPVEVGTRDVENLTLTLGPGIRLDGKVKWPEAAAADSNRRVNLSLRNLTNPENSSGTRVQPDGSFQLDELTAGTYRVDVVGLPDGMYVQSARLGSDDVFQNGLNAGSGGVLEIAIANGAAELQGTVTNADGQPAAGAVVAMVPKSESPYRDLKRSAVADQNGGFRLVGLVPGEYRLFAWEDIEAGAWLDPEFRKNHEAASKSLVLKENGREMVQIRVISSN